MFFASNVAGHGLTTSPTFNLSFMQLFSIASKSLGKKREANKEKDCRQFLMAFNAGIELFEAWEFSWVNYIGL